MKRSSLLLVVCALALSAAMAQPKAPANAAATPPEAEADIRALLQQQIDAWNKHDLEGFMAGYWQSPDLTFFSGGSITKGWQPTLERYRQSYQAKGNDMGKLEMSDIQVALLAPDAAYVTGKWHLTMPDGKTPHGLYTLILRHFPEGWRIVHDHSSAGQ